MNPTPPPAGRTSPLRRPVLSFWLVAVALEVLLAGLLLLTGADREVGRALDVTGLPFSTDLVSAVRLCLLYPAATLGVALAVAQVAAPDLAVALVAGRTPGGAGSLRAVLARFRFRGPGVGRGAALSVWARALGVLALASLATAALDILLFSPDEYRWPAVRTDLVPGLPTPALGLLAALLVTVALDAGALLEENGWRGYALPLLLTRWSPAAASLVLGLAWAAWHYPVKYNAVLDYGAIGGVGYLAAFTLKIVLLTFVITHYWQQVGGSTLLAVAMHGLSNDAVRLQGELLGDSARGAVLSELTIAAPLALVVVALWWRGAFRRRTGSRPI